MYLHTFCETNTILFEVHENGRRLEPMEVTPFAS